MMNDRFDAQLREHLLGSADTRPAEGQLEGVIQAVSGTAQRHPVAARLTWYPGRVGPFPTRAFRFALVAVALVAAMVAAVMFIGNGPARSTPFEGTWTSIDPGDGSAQSIVVAAGNAPAIHFVDHYASGLACRNDAVKVFTADGTATVSGNRLSVTWPNGGGCGLLTVDMGPGTYTYHEATDTILDDQQLLWVRAAEAPPTRGPATEPPPTPTGDPVPAPTAVVRPPAEQCVDLAPGSTYLGDAGPISLTATIPADATVTWEARGGGFSIIDFCSDLLAGSGPRIEASIVTSFDGTCEAGDTVEVTTPTDVIAALRGIQDVVLSELPEVTLGGHPTARFRIQPDARMCFDVVPLWNGFDVERGLTIIYVVDVDGLPLVITIADPGDSNGAGGIAEAEAIVSSLQIEATPGAQPSREPVPTPDPGCVQLDGTGSYTAPVGAISVTATVPDDTATTWSGSLDGFRLLRSPCGFHAPLTFEAQAVTGVAVDACRGLGESVKVGTAAEAATALMDQATTDATDRRDITIDGRAAVRLQLVMPDVDTSSCDEGAALLLGQTFDDSFIRIDPGFTYTVHLVEVDGTILAITALHESGGPEAATFADEIDAIIGSLQLGG